MRQIADQSSEGACSADFLTLAISEGFEERAIDFLSNSDGTIFCRRAGSCVLREGADGVIYTEDCVVRGFSFAVLGARAKEDALTPLADKYLAEVRTQVDEAADASSPGGFGRMRVGRNRRTAALFNRDGNAVALPRAD